MRSLVFALALVPSLSLGLASIAFASDGVGEINQTCAVQTGCFAGDAAGFPVTITTSGSYVLTSNLIVPDENTTAITVGANNVGIDLHDFTVSGPVTCSGSPTTCSPTSGTGSGIARSSSTIVGTSLRNGVVSGMGLYGVLLGDDAVVTGLRVRSNRSIGLNVGASSLVSGNTVDRNGTIGLDVSAGSTVSGNAISRNGTYGILVANGPAVVSDNTLYDNGGVGIDASFGSTVSGNAVYSNGNDGVVASGGTTIRGNSIRLNGGFGLNLGGQSSYGDNVITANVAGTVQGITIVNTGGNACNGLAVCP